MTDTVNLAKAGVIAKLRIRQWSGRRSDRQAARDTASRNRADKAMIRVSKDLIPRHALDAVRKIATEIRTYHYDNTISWEEGAHFLPTRLAISYTKSMQDFKIRFDSAVSLFCSSYRLHIAKAPQLLGDLYRQEDYPSTTEIRTLFHLDVAYEPVPESIHFLADLAAGTLAAFRSDLEERGREREQRMRQELWERLREPVVKMAQALGEPDRIFRDSLVRNVREMAERIDLLNVVADPSLASIAASVSSTLGSLDPEALRASAPDRLLAANAAQEIADRIERNMGLLMSRETFAA
jgi:hypothetical protein